MYFKFSEEALDEAEGKTIHGMMEGPQYLIIFYLLPDFDFQALV